MTASRPDQTLIESMCLHYQPIVRLADECACHAEVLARSAADDGTIHGPKTIVDAMTGAERAMNLTIAIMERGLAEYQAHGFGAYGLTLAFNLPLNAMLHPQIVRRIDETLAAFNLKPETISFELTEDQPVHDFDLAAARACILALRSAGYALALDDVTPSTTNLAALMDMPIRAIKLDRSVVISSAKKVKDFIRTVSAQATAHNQTIIAEGIETPDQRDSMHASGVTHGQGYLFSHPVPASGLSDFLKRN